MYLIGLLVLVGIAYFYFSSKKKKPSSNLNSIQTKSSAGSRKGATSFDSPIPKDCQIFAKHIPVAGMEYRKAEAFYVSIEKELTVDKKRQLKAEAKKNYELIKALNLSLSDNEIKIELIKQEIQLVREYGSWKDKWIHHPLPNMAEANKSMCWLTEHDDFDLTHKAWLYQKASLHGIDSFFQKVRRRIAMLERPIHSSSNNGRTWNGYGAYNPAMVVKLLEIFRVVHNYIDVRKEEGTVTSPAMRIGLMTQPIDYKDIVDFS